MRLARICPCPGRVLPLKPIFSIYSLLSLLSTLSKTLHINHLAIKCGLPAFAPALRGIPNPQYTNSPSLPMLFKPLNHIATKHRLSLLAPSGFLHFFNQTTGGLAGDHVLIMLVATATLQWDDEVAMHLVDIN